MRRHRQIALLGFPGVGKSSLAHHFVYKQFHREYDPNIKTSLKYQHHFAGELYDLLIVDNAGCDQYTLSHNDFDNSDAYILVYAIDDRQSFEMVQKIREKILSTSAVTKIPMVLVANKIDRKEDRVVTTDEGRALAQSWNVQFFEASAMDLTTVEKMFEKSLYAMTNSDYGTSTNSDENSSTTNSSNEKIPSAKRNGSNRKSSGNSSSKDDSNKNGCLLS